MPKLLTLAIPTYNMAFFWKNASVLVIRFTTSTSKLV